MPPTTEYIIESVHLWNGPRPPTEGRTNPLVDSLWTQDMKGHNTFFTCLGLSSVIACICSSVCLSKQYTKSRLCIHPYMVNPQLCPPDKKIWNFFLPITPCIYSPPQKTIHRIDLSTNKQTNKLTVFMQAKAYSHDLTWPFRFKVCRDFAMLLHLPLFVPWLSLAGQFFFFFCFSLLCLAGPSLNYKGD